MTLLLKDSISEREKNIVLENLNEHISDSAVTKNLAVFGMGFVGLPLALSFSLRGCNVTGVDIAKDLINNLQNGISYLTEEYLGYSLHQILKSQLQNGRFNATLDAKSAIKSCNNFIVTVGLPVIDGKPSFIYLEDVCRTIAKGLKPNDLVIIRSTVVPGTTERFVKPILEESGLKAGQDFHLAYASERIAEGRAFTEFERMPLAVAGINQTSSTRAYKLLKIVTKASIKICSSPRVVEMSKVVENAQRDVNIAMSHEIALACKENGLNVHEVIQVANTHTRVNLLTPGPGVGGYCIPNAFYYLASSIENGEQKLGIFHRARLQNDSIPRLIVERTKELLGDSLLHAKVAVLGLAMKDYSNDDRISPPIKIVQLLLQEGISVKAYDPAVITKYAFKVDEIDNCLKDASIVLILARQVGIEEQEILKRVPLLKPGAYIFDTKNVMSTNANIQIIRL